MGDDGAKFGEAWQYRLYAAHGDESAIDFDAVKDATDQGFGAEDHGLAHIRQRLHGREVGKGEKASGARFQTLGVAPEEHLPFRADV